LNHPICKIWDYSMDFWIYQSYSKIETSTQKKKCEGPRPNGSARSALGRPILGCQKPCSTLSNMQPLDLNPAVHGAPARDDQEQAARPRPNDGEDTGAHRGRVEGDGGDEEIQWRHCGLGGGVWAVQEIPREHACMRAPGWSTTLPRASTTVSSISDSRQRRLQGPTEEGWNEEEVTEDGKDERRPAVLPWTRWWAPRLFTRTAIHEATARAETRLRRLPGDPGIKGEEWGQN
jgi:hypothetical protein